MRKQRRITAADFRRTASPLQQLARALDEDDESDDEIPLPSKRLKTTRNSPEVVVQTPSKRRCRPPKGASAAAAALTPPRTPRPSVKRRGPGMRKPDAIHPYTYPSGNVIHLTKAELEEAQRDLVPVAEEVAHPPLAGLLFR